MPFRRKIISSLLAVSLSLVAGQSFAVDEWDDSGVRDNTAATTRNQLQPKAWQHHDLQSLAGAADQDWFVLAVTPGRSYEVMVGGITGDTPIANSDFLELYDATGTTLIQAAAGGVGSTEKFLRFTAAASNLRVRVKGDPGTVGQTRTMQYDIRLVESTMFCPRFNNSGTQVSILLLQNTTGAACSVEASFYDEAGAWLGTYSSSAAPSGMMVLQTNTVAGGEKGSVQINAAACSPTALKAKMVALEPATGFSFDTPCGTR